VAGDGPREYLQVPVDQPVHLEVIVVLPERVDQSLGHLTEYVTDNVDSEYPP
jgi:hypothetical protein